MRLKDQQQRALWYWLPGMIAGLLSWVAFVTLGHTSIIRASGLALVIVGMAMTLRRSGVVLATIGGLALALSPAFWSQTGGEDSLSLPITLIVLLVVGLMTALVMRFSRRWFLSLVIGFAAFAIMFWSQLASVGSLRLTTLSSAWLLYLLIDALYITNPRPDDPALGELRPRHTIGVLVLLAIGVINTPLFVLLAPAVAIGLILTHARLHWLHWLLLILIIIVGMYGVATEYISSTWWQYPAAQAQVQGIRVPYMMADGWREASRWIELVELVVGQFTIVGVVLGIIGLARLARWYPPLGTVVMIAYATHALFGLVYFGKNSAVLLLPLFMIQVFWMTYAIYALGEWLQRSANPSNQMLRWLAPAVYVWLPVLMLARIMGVI